MHTYYLLNLYSVACMHRFKVDHLKLANQPVRCFLQKTVSATLGVPCLSIVICVRLRPPGRFPYPCYHAIGCYLCSAQV